jgi:hypothetical protein
MPELEPVMAKLRRSSPVVASNTATRFPLRREAKDPPSELNVTGWTDSALVFGASVSEGFSPRRS